MFPFGVTVTVETWSAGSADAHGNSAPSWAAGVAVPGCGFDPGGTEEPFGEGRAVVVVTQPKVFMPSGTAITARDRVTVRGVTYQVVGDPADWVNPFTGRAFGLQVNLERVG